MPEYHVIDNSYMYALSRAMIHEIECQGCGVPYRDPNHSIGYLSGPLIAVITDRSGSEQTHSHNDKVCRERAIMALEGIV